MDILSQRFIGAYERAVDDKYRVVLPPDFRDDLSGKEVYLHDKREKNIMYIVMPDLVERRIQEITARLQREGLQLEAKLAKDLVFFHRQVDSLGRMTVQVPTQRRIIPGEKVGLVGLGDTILVYLGPLQEYLRK